MWRRTKAKFGAVRTEVAGRSFASKGEAACYEYLNLLHKDGQIGTIMSQVHVRLSAAQIVYVADFSFWCNQAKCQVWAEYKGFETPEWRLKRRLWKFYGPGPLRIYKGSRLRMKLTEEIIPESPETHTIDTSSAL